jgi:hypothetical protein
MPIHRPKIGKAQFLKHRPHLGHRQAFHPLLHVVRQGFIHKGQMLKLLLQIFRQKLHRRTQAQFIQIAGNRPHIGRNGHFIVIQHHHQPGFG